MALYIKDPQAEKLAGLLANLLHSNKTRVVIEALEEKYERAMPTSAAEESEQMRALARKLFGGPDLDTRSIDEIIGYDENGLPK